MKFYFKWNFKKTSINIGERKKESSRDLSNRSYFLTGFKLIIGLLTGSLGILSEALHGDLDLVAVVITYFTVRVSENPLINITISDMEKLKTFLLSSKQS